MKIEIEIIIPIIQSLHKFDFLIVTVAALR